MTETEFNKQLRYLAEVARRCGFQFDHSTPVVIDGRLTSLVELTADVSLPPLGVHVADGLASRDRMGGD